MNWLTLLGYFFRLRPLLIAIVGLASGQGGLGCLQNRVPTSTSSSSSSTTRGSRCTFQTDGCVFPLSADLTCLTSSGQCSIGNENSGVGIVGCDENEVMIDTACLTLSNKELFFSCLDGQLTVKAETHLFDTQERWNSANHTTFTGVTSISCADCLDSCVFTFASQRHYYSDTALELPPNALCDLKPTDYTSFYDFTATASYFSFNTNSVCKLPSGQETTIVCESLILQTSDGSDTFTLGSIPLVCNNGVLTSQEITGNVFDVICEI